MIRGTGEFTHTPVCKFKVLGTWNTMYRGLKHKLAYVNLPTYHTLSYFAQDNNEPGFPVHNMQCSGIPSNLNSNPIQNPHKLRTVPYQVQELIDLCLLLSQFVLLLWGYMFPYAATWDTWSFIGNHSLGVCFDAITNYDTIRYDTSKSGTETGLVFILMPREKISLKDSTIIVIV